MQQLEQELLEDTQLILYRNVLKQLMLKHLDDYRAYDEIQICYNAISHIYPSTVEEVKSKKIYLDLPQLIESISNRLIIVQSWQIGGNNGGTYEQQAQPYTLSLEERRPLFDFLLEQFLEIVSPEITLIDYRKMLQLCPIIEQEVEKSDYYSNSQIYYVKHINALAIFTFLKEHDLLLNLSQLENRLDNKLGNELGNKLGNDNSNNKIKIKL